MEQDTIQIQYNIVGAVYTLEVALPENKEPRYSTGAKFKDNQGHLWRVGSVRKTPDIILRGPECSGKEFWLVNLIPDHAAYILKPGTTLVRVWESYEITDRKAELQNIIGPDYIVTVRNDTLIVHGNPEFVPEHIRGLPVSRGK